MSRFFLVRPGCTEFDEQQRIQGRLDLPLSCKGVEQVERLLAELADRPLDKVYCCPTEPALTTARQLAQAHGIPFKVLPGLANIDQGLWQGLPWEELKRKQPRVYRQWLESPELVCPPAGESLSDAAERVREALHRPLKKHGQFAIVAPDPVASLIAAVVRGQPVGVVSPLCTGRCGTWEELPVAEMGSAPNLAPDPVAVVLRPAQA
jgi:broad specificity phosphatase PhoE